MLEAERAGAKALVVFMDEHARNGESWKVLRNVQADEAHNCALIGRLLEREGAQYSHATEFYDKAVALQGARARRVPVRGSLGGEGRGGGPTLGPRRVTPGKCATRTCAALPRAKGCCKLCRASGCHVGRCVTYAASAGRGCA
jgi:hypothetical protein